MIQLQTVSLQRGTKFLLQDANLTIFPGQKVGLIGANGSGKSSLFKMLLGQLGTDSGSCDIPKDWRIAHMAQEVSDVERSALDYVLDGDQELRRLERAISNDNGCGNTLANLYTEMEHINAYSAPARAQQLLNGLGFKPDDSARPVTDFSGGWRIRLNLARALMCPSDLLLLDEPTNHLDLDATLWLELWLQRYPGTLVIISHDRDFLDNIVERIVNIEQTELIVYSGNYSAYERQRAERLAQQQASFEKQQERIAHVESFIRRFRAQATKAKQAQSRIKQLERMEKIAPAHIDSPFTFQFTAAEKVSDPLLLIRKANIGYADREVLSNVSISITPTTRIGLLGPNGAGKSSLIKTLAGSLRLRAGDRIAGEHFKLGYFAQHQLEALDITASSALHIQRLSPTAREQEIRNFLGEFGFKGDRAFETIEHFSGGEKARLALAIVAWQKPNVLLLDEPTNHLDLEMRQAITMALQDFAGAVIVVSHDRHLLRNTVDEWLLVADGTVREFDGELDDYYQWLLEKKQDNSTDKKSVDNTSTDSPVVDKKMLRQQAAQQREKLKPLTNKIKKLEKELETLQPKLLNIEEQLADSNIYADENKSQLQKLMQEQSNLQKKINECEEQWLEVQDELENIAPH